jgi:hypothetical protein
MGPGERLTWWLFGCAVGYILGYIVRSLREIKEELHEVDDIVKSHDERGFMRNPIVADIMVLLAVGLTAWAAFSSQSALNSYEQTQDRITRITICNQQFLAKTISALNERTTYTQDQVASSVRLNKAQGEFFRTIFENPADDGAELQAFRAYLNAYEVFLEESQSSKRHVSMNPYPTNEELAACLGRNE